MNTHSRSLPTSSDTLIGRDHELALLVSALRNAQGAMVTLVGPGGVGKTRLARVVTDLLQPAANVRFVPLAPVTNVEQVPFAIAAASGNQLTPDGPAWPALHRQLGTEPTILVLDNLEHLPDLSPHLSDILLAAPHTTIFATSRRAAGIRSERVVELAPLSTAAASGPSSLSDAARLFIAVGTGRSNEVDIPVADRDAIEEVCRLLDGLPLAIELVASRLRMMSPQSILDTLGIHRQTLLTLVNGHDAHHRTLQHTIERSYEAVSVDSRTLLRAIALTPAGMTHAMAESVLGHDPAAALIDLTSHHLAQRVTDDDGIERFTLLDTIRTFALARLAQDPAAGEIRLSLLEYLVSEANMVAATRSTADEPEAMRRLERELPTILPLLDASLASATPDEVRASARLLIGLRPLIEAVGPLGQSAAWLDQLMFLIPEHDRLLPTVVYTAGRIAHFQGRLDTAARHMTWALEHGGDDPELTALTRHGLGLVASRQGRYDDALMAFDTAANLFAALGEQAGVLRAENAQGLVYIATGEFVAARTLLDRALARARQTDNPGDEAMVLGNLAYLEQASGHAQEAVSLLESVITIADAMRYRLVQATANANLAQVWLELGDGVAAREYAGIALELFRRFGGMLNEAEIYDGLAHLAWLEGAVEEELQHRIDALTLQQIVGNAGDQARTLVHLARLWWLMGNETRAAAALQQASRLLPDPAWPIGPKVVSVFEAVAAVRSGQVAARESVAVALDGLGQDVPPETFAEWERMADSVLPPDLDAPSADVQAVLATLSERERQVLMLVGGGKSDREIAWDLSISPRTAGFHVSNILRKLDVTTRIEAAAWAARHRLG